MLLTQPTRPWGSIGGEGRAALGLVIQGPGIPPLHLAMGRPHPPRRQHPPRYRLLVEHNRSDRTAESISINRSRGAKGGKHMAMPSQLTRHTHRKQGPHKGSSTTGSCAPKPGSRTRARGSISHASRRSLTAKCKSIAAGCACVTNHIPKACLNRLPQ